jgi:hypothetical protein
MLYEERLDRLQNQWDKDTYLKAGENPRSGEKPKRLRSPRVSGLCKERYPLKPGLVSIEARESEADAFLRLQNSSESNRLRLKNLGWARQGFVLYKSMEERQT